MTTTATRTSGTSKIVLPKIFQYPHVHRFDQVVPYLKSHLCYVFRHYGNDGIAAAVIRKPKEDKVAIMFGDWSGNNLELDSPKPSKHKDAAIEFAQRDFAIILKLMQAVHIQQAQFFLAFSDNGLILTDIQTGADKFSGPGMVRDLFGKSYRVPEMLKLEPFDDRVIEYVQKGTGTYEGDLLIKPSKFSLFSPAKGPMVPLYAEIKRT